MIGKAHLKMSVLTIALFLSLLHGLHVSNGLLWAENSATVVLQNGFFGSMQSQGGIPPDVQVATGPAHVVVATNHRVEIYRKDGSLVESFTLCTFMYIVNENDCLNHFRPVDPRVLFDDLSQRWFFSAMNKYSNSLIIRVSPAADPRQWVTFYSYGTVGLVIDKPLIGVSDTLFAISADTWSSSGSYLGSRVWVMDKMAMANGLGADAQEFGPYPTTVYSIAPAHHLSSSPSSPLWLVSTYAKTDGSDFITLYSVEGIPPSASINSRNLRMSNPIYLPPDAEQPGTSILIDTNDAGVLDAAWFQGRLWFALNDRCRPTGDGQDRACIRLMEADASSGLNQANILQEFDFGLVGRHVFYPALRLNSEATLGLIYGFSSSAVYPSLAVTAQRAFDPDNSLAVPVTVWAGSYSNNVPGGRYGDYFGASIDRVTNRFVMAGEYITGLTNTICGFRCWGTWTQIFSVPTGGGGGGGGGSVAYGSLIEMADGTALPVQNVKPGDSVVTYNPLTSTKGQALVSQIRSTLVNSLLTIHTSAKLPLRVDYNPYLKIAVLADAGPALKPVTELQLGDRIFNYYEMAWVEVTGIQTAFGGQHVMFDIFTDPLLDYVANGYPDCPCQK